MLATLPRTFEGVRYDAAEHERCADADFGGGLLRGRGPDRTAGAGVGAFGALADHHEIDVRVTGQRAAHTRIQPCRTQVDVMVQLEAQPQQTASAASGSNPPVA